MRILVTGGAGCIGSHACKAIAQAGHGRYFCPCAAPFGPQGYLVQDSAILEELR